MSENNLAAIRAISSNTAKMITNSRKKMTKMCKNGLRDARGLKVKIILRKLISHHFIIWYQIRRSHRKMQERLLSRQREQKTKISARYKTSALKMIISYICCQSSFVHLLSKTNTKIMNVVVTVQLVLSDYDGNQRSTSGNKCLQLQTFVWNCVPVTATFHSAKVLFIA